MARDRLEPFPIHSQEEYQPKLELFPMCIHALRVIFVATMMPCYKNESFKEGVEDDEVEDDENE
jgi:hypothetical protein